VLRKTGVRRHWNREGSLKRMRPLALAFVLLGSVAFGKPPTGQGSECDARKKCTGGLECVEHDGGKSTCEIVCGPNKRCPQEQRCVREGVRAICRPTVLGYPGL